MGAGGIVGSLGGGVIYQYGGGRAVFITLSVSMIPFAVWGLLSKADRMPDEFFSRSAKTSVAGAEDDEYTPLLDTTEVTEIYSDDLAA